MIYSSIVESKVRESFDWVNQRNYEPVLKGCTDDIHHSFGGNHALGGKRKTKAGFKRWLERLGTVYPDLKLVVQDVYVVGGPWHTVAIVRWDFATNWPDGKPGYVNHGVHIVEMKWGKVFKIDANEDSQIVEQYLKQKAAAGEKEAAAPPIEE